MFFVATKLHISVIKMRNDFIHVIHKEGSESLLQRSLPREHGPREKFSSTYSCTTSKQIGSQPIYLLQQSTVPLGGRLQKNSYIKYSCHCLHHRALDDVCFFLSGRRLPTDLTTRVHAVGYESETRRTLPCDVLTMDLHDHQ